MRRCAALVGMWMAFVALTAAEPKADMVANPPYKNWSAFKVGTTVKLLQTVVDKSGDAPGVIDATARPEGPAETYITYKLLQLTPEKAVVSMTQTEVGVGSQTEHAPVKIT